MADNISLDDKFSTTRLLTKENSIEESSSKNRIETNSNLPNNNQVKSKGGLRTKGYSKKSYTNKPLVSIVTVVYNGEKFLEKTILSILNQTYDNVEYIIIDGGSTDGTIDIIKKYENYIDYWISEKDNGIYDAMNKGIKLANGQWINFMNAGDSFYNNKVIEDLSHILIDSNRYIVYGDTILSTGKIKKAHPIKWLIYGMFTVHQSIFFRKANILHDTSYRISGDYHFILQYLNKFGSKSFHYCNGIISIFDMQGESNKNRHLGNKETLIIALRELNIPVFIATIFYYIRRLRSLKGVKKNVKPDSNYTNI